MTYEKLTPVTPGEILLEEFMIPMKLTKYRLAKDIGVSAQRIGQIVAGKRAISADTDLRLCKYFGLSEGYWLRLQNKYDVVIEKDKIKDQLELIIPIAKRNDNLHP
jgi:addiction module HigA family antidote